MRKTRFLWLVPALLLLLSSCGRAAPIVERYDGTHQHTYGACYTVQAVTCLEPGAVVRYCGICRKPEVTQVPVAPDEADRNHDFSHTVVPPTEAEWGYTVKRCNACGYTVDRADKTPPLYALLTDAATSTALPQGVTAALRADSKSHLLQLSAAADTAVDAEIARRLGVALAVTALMEEEGSVLTADTAVAVVTGGLAGRTYTLRQLITAFIKTGSEDTALALADACGETAADFSLRVQRRIERLGLQNSAEIHPVLGAKPQKATLYGTAVLLVRALDTPLIATALAEAVPDLSQVAGQKPAVYLTDAAGTLRVTALQRADGTYDCLLLYGALLPTDAEEAILSVN
ncbi:MAG: hypothetical protein E7644_07695 [Ruminococcaceae bacterium]|nr:hypothetical protein [Oscillospiraceae bacterium]